MAEQTETLILELLGDVSESVARMGFEVADLKLRMSATEQHLGQMQIQLGP